jgi:hypothetical protein
MFHVAAGGQLVTNPCVYEARASLGRIGAPYGQYLLDDVIAGKVHAKLYVFLNAWNLNAAQRAKLRVATRGSVCVWCYAPGYLEVGGSSQKAIEGLTGFRVAQNLDQVNAWAAPVANDAGLKEPFGVAKSVKPLFAIHAPPGEILGTYPDGIAAVALHRGENGDATSIFVGPPGLTSELLRFAARQAGVHLFTDTDCNVYASGPFVALHGAQDGPIHLHAGSSGPVKDILSDETLGHGPDLDLPLRRGETRILRYGP